MVQAGWLKSHIFTTGNGHHLVWTPQGGQRAVLLKDVASSHGLDQDDRAPLCFDILCQGKSLPAGVSGAAEVDPLVAGFWQECVGELGLHGDEDGLIALIQIVDGWAPDGETEIRLG